MKHDTGGRSITVFGCGWLGIPFCIEKIKHGWNVLGTTTSEDKISKLENFGIQPFRVMLPTSENLPESLFEVDHLLISLPPGRSDPDRLNQYPIAIRQILNSAKKSAQIKPPIAPFS